MKSKKTILSLFLCLILTLSLFAGCSKNNKQANTNTEQQPTQAAEQRGGELKIATDRNPRNINPIFADDTASERVDALLFSGLLDTDEKNNLIPKVAAELPQIDRDNMTITFKLRQGWKWHDGQELTSDDVKFTYELILDKAVNSPRRADFEAIKSIETPDKYTVVFKLGELDSQIVQRFAAPRLVPKHILETADRTKLKDSDFSKNPVGNGPFKFVEWKTSERIVLEAFNDYLPGKAKLDRVVFDITPSQATAVLKVETGEDNYCSLLESDIDRMSKNTNVNVYTYLSTHFDCIQWNNKLPFFSDKKVRQALSYAIDKNALITGIFKGQATPALTSYPPSIWAFNPDVQKYDYNIEKAKQLLDEAGWKAGPDGIRVKDGKKFEFTLLTNKGDPTRENTVVFVQSALKEVGIKVNPKILEWNTLFDQYVGPKKFDAYVGGYSAGTDIMHDAWYAKDGMFNDGSYDNPKVDELFKKIKGTFDQEEQKKYVFEIQQIIAEDQPMTYLVNTKSSVALSNNVKDAQFFDNVGAFNMEKWYMAK